MKINPVKEYKKPEYPDYEDFISCRSSFIKSAPAKWRKNPVVWAALVSLVLSNQSCDTGKLSRTKYELIKFSIKNDGINNEKNIITDTTFIAPIFKHGSGVGSFGCIIVNPPVFLNENDAKEIVINEFRKNDIFFNSSVQPKSSAVQKISFDGYNEELNLAFCFISYKKYSSVSYYESDDISAYSYDLLSTAARINLLLENYKDINAVVFYDPVASVEYKSSSSFEKRKQNQLKKSKELLEEQVDEAIVWLKNNKIKLKDK